MKTDDAIKILDEFYDVLGQELNWSEEHFDSIDKSFDYKYGFLFGLRQARDLLIDFEIAVLKG